MRGARRVKLVFDDDDDDDGGGGSGGHGVKCSGRGTVLPSLVPAATTPATASSEGAATVTGTAEVSVQGQKHFYMETQTCLADPLSNGKGHVLVHSACQVIGLLRAELALQLRKLLSRVEVRNTQVGGAYGGKAFYPAFVAVRPLLPRFPSLTAHSQSLTEYAFVFNIARL